MNELYVGLMSGTSLDGVDGVLVDFHPRAEAPLRVIAHVHRPFERPLVDELMALNSPTDNELHRAALAANAITRHYAQVVVDLLAASAKSSGDIRAVGAHGQTVRHRPQSFDGTGYTVQLLNGALLAERVGIDVVADLRSRDVAAGGQGAPLVPAFHRAVFGQSDTSTAVLNIGGISNLTILAADGSTSGFDCGPGNALMDHWCLTRTGRPWDDRGTWAASGKVVAALLDRLRQDPYFSSPPPKSTGRDLFNPTWLDGHLAALGTAPAEADVQATLTEFTASICADAVHAHAPEAKEMLVCGGGALNAHLMARLGVHLPGVSVLPTDLRGLPADQVEASAFAWLARAFVERQAGNLPKVTGAAGPRVLGALYPGR